MDCFSINQDMGFIIYGAGGNCYHIKNLLQNAKYSVEAILDKRAETIHDIEMIPVYTLEKFALMDDVKQNRIIIISVKNVFEHINIVRELLEQGYKNIIYKPFPVLQGEQDEEWDSINYAYEMIVEHEKLLDLRQKQIACSRGNHLMTFKDELYMKEDKEKVMCWMPVELVCNYSREDAYKQLPMAAYYPLLNLYRYLLDSGIKQGWEDIEKDFFLYAIDWVERTGKEFTDSLKSSMLNSRIDVFGEMQKKADIDKDFFVRNAVSVKRIDSLRFSLSTSGRNRVSFLIARGSRFIPVYVSREDYNAWMNPDKFEKLRQYLEKMKINKLFAAVPHPMMISYKSETIDYIHLFCMPVVREIYRLLHWKSAGINNNYYKINVEKYNERKSELKIFAAVKDEGCIGRLLLMYGINCYRLCADEKQKEISKLIDELFWIKDSGEISADNCKDIFLQCRILIVDSRMIIPFITDFKGTAVFLLQWGESNRLGDLEERFTRRRLLFQTIWQREKVSGWMLDKD